MDITTIHRSGFLSAQIRITLNDLECPIQLKVRFTDGTLNVRMLWLSELAKRDSMSMAFTVPDKNEANEL